jgi:hypothetical protein
VALRYAVGNETGQPWDERDVLATGGQDDRTSVQLGVRGPHGPGVATPCDADHRCVLVDRRDRGEVGEPGDDLGGRQVGITGLLAQHRVHPAWVVQPQRVPPLRTPRLPSPSAFEHSVVDTALDQRCARSQPSRPSPEDQAVD